MKFDDLMESAVANYGLVTTAEAAGMGIARKDLCDWVKRGRLTKCGHGVYRVRHYLPTEYDHYAEAVALVGGKALLWGESVLAMHNLAMVNPLHIFVATDRRVRKRLPDWLKTVKRPTDCVADDFNGIPCQNLASVIRDARGKVMADRLREAVAEAERKGLLRVSEVEELRKEFAR